MSESTQFTIYHKYADNLHDATNLHTSLSFKGPAQNPRSNGDRQQVLINIDFSKK